MPENVVSASRFATLEFQHYYHFFFFLLERNFFLIVSAFSFLTFLDKISGFFVAADSKIFPYFKTKIEENTLIFAQWVHQIACQYWCL